MCEDYCNNGTAEFNYKLFNGEDKNFMHVTCKDYKTKKGVASQLFRVETTPNVAIVTDDKTKPISDVWHVRGPMGMGLDVQASGHHVAFCGGTGVLVFLDIVARMALQTCKVLPESEKPFADDFSFMLYYAAPSMTEAIGVELCQHFEKVCSKAGYEKFKFVLRLSDSTDKGPRWDKDFLEKELKPLAGKIRKIFACGAPSMNETFDRALGPMIKDLQLDAKDLEIL